MQAFFVAPGALSECCFGQILLRRIFLKRAPILVVFRCRGKQFSNGSPADQANFAFHAFIFSGGHCTHKAGRPFFTICMQASPHCGLQ